MPEYFMAHQCTATPANGSFRRGKPFAAREILVTNYAKADILKALGDLQQATGRIS